MSLVRFSAIAATATFCFALLTPSACAETDVTERYLEHYLSGDIAGLAPYMSETIHFHDSVSWFDGKEAVLEGLTQVFADIPDISFEESTRYRSGHDTLVDGILIFDNAGRALGVPGRVFHFEMPFAVSLREVDGKIVSHVDFVDGPTFMTQFEAQLEAEH
ncbi:nuclear transport factor 2 family protein [Hyphomonas sp.]|uniref:nuclear transport factor 2 family protein n=1 Tax=Hyphomonas sp. TaxID=87 RepID=UPI003528E9FC